MDNINSSGSSGEFEPSEIANSSDHQATSTDAIIRRREEIEKYELARREEILDAYERRINEQS